MRIFFLTMIIPVSRTVLEAIIRKLSINQVYQMTPLETPMAFSVSFSLVSFSSTMLFTTMDTEYIQASTMKMGKQRFRVSINLDQRQTTQVQLDKT